jgi:hypothetical protein
MYSRSETHARLAANAEFVLADAEAFETEVQAEPTATFFSADQLGGFPEMAVSNPLYGITTYQMITR